MGMCLVISNGPDSALCRGRSSDVNVAYAYVRMNEDYENAEWVATTSGVKCCGVSWCGVVWDSVV